MGPCHEFGGLVVGPDQRGVRDDDLDQRLARGHRLDRAARTGRDIGTDGEVGEVGEVRAVGDAFGDAVGAVR
jgi:hypothetical protein